MLDSELALAIQIRDLKYGLLNGSHLQRIRRGLERLSSAEETTIELHGTRQRVAREHRTRFGLAKGGAES